MVKLYLVRISGEVILKASKTRIRFEKRLVKNIIDMCRKHGIFNLKIKKSEARIFIEGPEKLESILCKVFGIYSYSPVVKVDFSDLEDLSNKAKDYFKNKIVGKKFAVRVKRAGKHDFTSIDAARKIGSKLYKYSNGVDLKNPEVEVFVEIRNNHAFFFDKIIKGSGGLPIGVNGRAVSLFSGGFDSPVASWFVWKRGVELDFVYCYLGGLDAKYRTVKVLKTLVDNWCSGYTPKLHIVDFRPIVSDIIKNVKKELRQVILRRAMYRVAEIIAREVKASAIVTGESLGQVSSQTLWNIAVAEEIVRIPILRPLIGLDKEEIINLARKIGTYELSSKIREYCAIARGKVATRAKLSDVKMEEKKISSDVIEDAAKKREIYNVFEINPIDFLPVENVAINFIPSEALLIDLREREDFEKWHPPNAIHIEDLKIDSLPKDRVIIAYCDSGVLSSEFAASLRKKGFKAFSFEGGLSQLRYKACK